MLEVVVASADDTKVLALMQPRHTHDCDCCQFLGYADFAAHVELDRSDVWYHGGEEGGALILRHGSDGPEYHSFPLRLVRMLVEQRNPPEWRLALALYDAWVGSPNHNVPRNEWRGIALMQAA